MVVQAHGDGTGAEGGRGSARLLLDLSLRVRRKALSREHRPLVGGVLAQPQLLQGRAAGIVGCLKQQSPCGQHVPLLAALRDDCRERQPGRNRVVANGTVRERLHGGVG